MITKRHIIDHWNLYPLRFDPIFQYRPWGGRRLENLFDTPLPGDGPIGEAWLLSDRADCSSCVADGPLKGLSIGQLFQHRPEQLMGKLSGRFLRFPLLLKYLDVRDTLSVQVHPSGRQTSYLPEGESGKTEAWVVLEAGENGRIWAGLKPAAAPDTLRRSLAKGTVSEQIASFTPKPGDGILIPAGTVHSMGDTMVFEVQENSDVTFRLYDWDRVDLKTGRVRLLQVEQAMACIDFAQGEIGPVVPVIEAVKPVLRERILSCEHFGLRRIRATTSFTVGAEGMPRVLVCLEGEGCIEYDRTDYAFGKGNLLLLPAVVGQCLCRPRRVVNLLDISLPEES